MILCGKKFILVLKAFALNVAIIVESTVLEEVKSSPLSLFQIQSFKVYTAEQINQTIRESID